jgi:hypothetical protein
VARFPETRRDDVVEVLHGRTIADPYRWLEDPDSAETAEWVKRQNEFTAAYLESLPDRPWFLDTMQHVMGRPRAGVPFKRAGHYFVTRNDGTQNQDVTYVASSLEELLAGGRVLVDPNTFSDDGTSSLASLTVSGNGQLVAYGISEAGSDWSTFRLLSLASGEEVDDALIQTKFSQAEWLPDHRSYVYTHFDHEGHPDGTQTAALAGPKLRLHHIGDSQDHDEVIMEFPENDQLMFWAEASDDDRYLVVSIVEGTENKNRLWIYTNISGERSELGMPSLIGLVMLLGIVTKNSILLVEYAIMARRDRGMTRKEALLDACHKRARPIVMTTIAMGAGMMPIALGLGTDPSFRAPMAIVVIGGLITSTFLSLLVIPVVFTYVDDFVTWMRGWRRRPAGGAAGTLVAPADRLNS